jgi:hypothetical protein
LNCDGEIANDAKILCRFEVRDARGQSVYADHAGVELRGRTSIQYPKKNYAIELRTSAGAENATNLLGMGQESDWVLDGSWVDRSFMRNDLAFGLYRDAGYYAPESRYCALQLNGEPRGIYRLCEKIKRDDDRVALVEDNGTGNSFIIKQDTEGVVRFTLGLEARWQLIYPKQSTATTAQVASIQSWLDGLAAALEDATSDGPGSGVFSYLDFDSTVDYILVQELSKNVDAYTLSVHFARNASEAARFVPWDFDLSFGQPTIQGASNESPPGWIYGRTPFIVALSRSAALRAALATRFRQLRAGPFSDSGITQKLDFMQAGLPPSLIEQNFAVWPIQEVNFTQIVRRYSLYPVQSYSEEVTRLRAWIRQRLEWLDANIQNYPD